MESSEEEAALDLRNVSSCPAYTDSDYAGHRACTVYIGLHVAGQRKKNLHKHHHRRDYSTSVEYGQDINKPATPPSERVHFILGEEDGSHEPHPLFSEMEELFKDGQEMEWRETARWVKFEEDVEEGGNRWSKPHVATVSLHSLFELRSCILNGTILLDMNANSLEEISDIVLESMISVGQIQSDQKDKIKTVLLFRHRHQHERHNEWSEKGSRKPIIRSFTDIGRNTNRLYSHNLPHTSTAAEEQRPSLATHASGNSESEGSIPQNTNSTSIFGNPLSVGKSSLSDDSTSSDSFLHKINQAFMRKIPPKSEASNILVGEVEYLDKVISAFVRLSESCELGDLTEVPLGTRFLFILLGPVGNAIKYHEIGRAMATVLSDEVFHDVAYKAKTRLDLLAGVDEFLDATTVLPPGAWDPSTRIEPPTEPVSQESRKQPDPKENEINLLKENESILEDHSLERTGRLFGGLICDVKRKVPWYISDFKDYFALQCIASTVFLYFACIAPIITFGGLLGHATNQRMAATETLLSAVICGTIYSLCSGQPLTLLGSTGPVLVFEGIVYDMCGKFELNYLSMRVLIGLWTSLWLIVIVAFDLSTLVRYITRFTEEIFATLISTIFVYKAFQNLLQIQSDFPLKMRFSLPPLPLCTCIYNQDPVKEIASANIEECHMSNGTLFPTECSFVPHIYVPDVFLLSVILFLGTFSLIIILRGVKNTSFFPSKVRTCISDFSVVIAIVCMTILDVYTELPTPKLDVPQEFKPTWTGRQWIVPFFGENPWWTIILAILPSLLVTVLIFMDQQITAVIVNRKENKLKKGCGYHLDLFILAILIAICSILGLPWFVAATVLSISHVNSLKLDSQCSAPGEKPHFLGVKEQRVTHLFVSVLIGLSVFVTPVLKLIPMPVLYGVFLFMGITSLKGLQFYDRTLVMLMPEKYQPDYSYLRHVPIAQVRWYTLIQLFLLFLLFCCKLFKPTSILFPLLLVAIVLIRKGLGFFFDEVHLKIMDDNVPEMNKQKKGDLKDTSTQQLLVKASDGTLICASSKDKVKNNSDCSINISEVLMQSGIWKSIDQQSQKSPPRQKKLFSSRSKKKKRSNKRIAEEKRRLSVMAEEDEDHCSSPTSGATSPPQPPSKPCDFYKPSAISTETIV